MHAFEHTCKQQDIFKMKYSLFFSVAEILLWIAGNSYYH